MHDSELYEKLLGLKEPWFVEKVSLDLSAACQGFKRTLAG